MKFTIYQENDPMFRVDSDKKDYDLSQYHKVYENTVINYFGNPGIEHKVALEILFEDFNRDYKPQSYTGHSMSVGDIVKFGNTAYICDSIGWNEINLKGEQ